MPSLLRKLIAAPVVDAGPLDHPDLRDMSLRDLADLPLPRWKRDDDPSSFSSGAPSARHDAPAPAASFVGDGTASPSAPPLAS